MGFESFGSIVMSGSKSVSAHLQVLYYFVNKTDNASLNLMRGRCFFICVWHSSWHEVGHQQYIGAK